ncbi:Hypothetical predicted protein [Paramuricea clavata]|uniref:Uncharacterized protein n=1 Tax=Paramuricea clavata TaxID=317549 RepID=A0A7D9DYR2_PARCT|nr:Hypothetical predicted protein [Paramuricea clavata]
MANRLQSLHTALQSCYDHDINWTLLPEKLHRVCALFGKGLKQQASTVLLGFLSLISFCIGHGAIDVAQFWREPSILWLVIVLPTGFCVSGCERKCAYLGLNSK